MRDVGRYIEECDLCQRMKNRMEELVGKLKLSEVPEKLWTYLMVNFIMKLPVIAGKNAILVVCNRLSKIMYFVATTEETSAEGLARLFKNNIWKLHGLPVSQIRYSLVVILELNSVSEVQYKGMMIDR